MTRVRLHPRQLKGAFESEAKLLEKVTDHRDGFPFGTLNMPPDEPLRSAEEERRRGDCWRTAAIFWRFSWGIEKGMSTYNGRRSSRQGKLKCPCIYDWVMAEVIKDPGATNDKLVNRFPELEDKCGIYRGFDEKNQRQTFIDGCSDHDDRWVPRSGLNRYITKAREALGMFEK